MKLIMVALSRAGTTIFRNNVAQAWVGKSHRFTARQQITVEAGDVIIKNARPLHAGLCVGSSDLIGWTPRVITPEMVGQTVAIFTAVEVKSATGTVKKDQLNFLSNVQKSGGLSVLARSPQDAVTVVTNNY